jgi:hypothetical protein
MPTCVSSKIYSSNITNVIDTSLTGAYKSVTNYKNTQLSYSMSADSATSDVHAVGYKLSSSPVNVVSIER